MPARNALGAVSLTVAPLARGSFRIALKVWSHSYDDPDPARRNALIKRVRLTGLTAANTISNAHITDRYGIDETDLWFPEAGVEPGFVGYTEMGPVKYGTQTIGVVWGSYSGIYDERCAADVACDAMRLQTHISAPHQLSAYNYMFGPLTFAFDLKHRTPPNAVKLTMGHIGGNGGNPAQRWSLLPDEEFIIEFP